MTTQTEALKLALDALENHSGNYKLSKAECAKHEIVIAAIKEALAQPEQEPVAWLVYAKGSRRYFTLTFDVEKVPEIYKGGEAVPLYTTQPQRTWVVLTDDEKETLSYQAEGNTWTAVELAEAKLKKKNT